METSSPETMMFTAKACGAFVAVLFGICFYIGYAKGEEFGIKPLNFSDKFDIGYIGPPVQVSAPVKAPKVTKIDAEDEEEKRRLQKLRNKIERIKLEKQLYELQHEFAQPKKAKPQTDFIYTSDQKTIIKEKKVDVKPVEQNNPLFDECVNALVSLGEKKSSAIKMAKTYFESNPNTSTVNDFILGVFKK